MWYWQTEVLIGSRQLLHRVMCFIVIQIFLLVLKIH